jgi:UDP-glucose 4-epimerase
MSICLVTGGAGFIGSHLVEALVARGHEVRVLDNFNTGSFANLSKVSHGVEVILGEVEDSSAVRRATEGAEFVFHLAPPLFAACEAALLESPSPNNDIGTLEVLRCARSTGVRRVIFASTFRVYDCLGPPHARANHFLQRCSPYAAAKLAAELDCAAFTSHVGLETVCLRYFRVFGPRQLSHGLDWNGILPILSAMLANHRPLIQGTGSEPQDVVYVDDVVHATLLAAWAPRAAGRVYEIGRGRSTTMNDIVATCNAILGTRMQPVYSTNCYSINNHGFEPPSQADISPAEVELGFVPSVNLDQGLRQCLAHYARLTESLLPSSSPNT